MGRRRRLVTHFHHRSEIVAMSLRTSRRKFLQGAAVAAPLVISSRAWANPPSRTLNVGFVATGGKARVHIEAAKQANLNCLAFADVDRDQWSNVLKHDPWKNAAGYSDWRKMFENHAKDLDVVFVTTPDHSHFAPTMTAVSLGIHCYTEKPLTWSVREAQLLAQAYEKNPTVVTQMGNQGHAGDGWRRAYEIVKSGVLGDIVEFHTWTNRPIWPQGGGRPPQAWEKPAPANLDWDAWIGPAPLRPYAAYPDDKLTDKQRKRGPGVYHPHNWRAFVDFGSGALGDMACHTTDGIYSIMKPGYAETGEPLFQSTPVTDQWQQGMIFKMTFRATKERPGFATYWYEGTRTDGSAIVPETPEELLADGETLPKTGNLVIGTKGKMLVEGDYWNTPRLLPKSKAESFGTAPVLLERSPGHHEEFFMACRGDKPRSFSQSNFGYSGPMTANIQLGNLAARAGKKLVLDPAGKITNDPAVNDLAWREPRAGWGPLEMKV
jgi:predicted dehydrogenase